MKNSTPKPTLKNGEKTGQRGRSWSLTSQAHVHLRKMADAVLIPAPPGACCLKDTHQMAQNSLFDFFFLHPNSCPGESLTRTEKNWLCLGFVLSNFLSGNRDPGTPAYFYAEGNSPLELRQSLSPEHPSSLPWRGCQPPPGCHQAASFPDLRGCGGVEFFISIIVPTHFLKFSHTRYGFSVDM